MRRIIFIFMFFAVGILPAYAQDISDDLDALVSEYAAEDSPALVMQVTSPDGVWIGTGGLADGERPAQADDRFRIASMSKTFVAALTVMLADEGVFDLDDPAHNWLPREIVGHIANMDTVTIRQLLQMRSGIPDYLETDEFWNAAMDDPTREWSAGEALEYAFDLPAMFKPGTDYYYSNSNYLLLQIILEFAYPLPMYESMREKILDPLGLKDTYTQVKEDLPGGFVHGYEDMDGDGEAEDVTDFNDGAGLGDGGLVSNTADITTFYRALLQDRTLLSPAAMDELFDFQPTDSGAYSLGLDEWESEYGTVLGHSGAVSGFVSIGMYWPEHELIIVVLSADIEIDPEEIALEAAGLLLD